MTKKKLEEELARMRKSQDTYLEIISKLVMDKVVVQKFRRKVKKDDVIIFAGNITAKKSLTIKATNIIFTKTPTIEENLTFEGDTKM